MKRKSVKKRVGKLVSERDIAMNFAVKVQEKFDTLVKASILFGSQAKNTASAKSDIDIILVVDDASVEWDLELIAWYRTELGKVISSKNYGGDLHVNTIKLTTWWQDLIHGDPVVLNILRYGEPLVDLGGFFTPLKSLLVKGKIKSSPEAALVALQRAPTHLVRSKMAEMSAIEGIYWTMVDSAQAALITAGKMPPSPEYVGDMLKEAFVDTGMLHTGYVKAFNDLFAMHKGISHGKVSEVKGSEIDRWQDIAEKFMTEMTNLVNKLIDLKK
ncbi:MAG TPA: nucleotidyltransferase domain-containing protein [Candidatus Nanoarchaeia archaeon]|nr:nucleotidyltransferase domain-containing protein [Candidatus Nanoarchaeia archaeon]